MAKEQFSYPETVPLFRTLEDISQRSGVSRAQAFENTLQSNVCCLAAETMEPEYLDAIKDHTEGPVGKRGVDLMAKFFGQLIESMSRTDKDLLGDLFQSSISYGEHGLFLTPEQISTLMAKLTINDLDEGEDGRPLRIHDPCGGTGRMLLAASVENPRAELVGMDVDPRCALIMDINFGLRGKYGWVICGNSLSREVRFVHRIGSFFHEGPNGRRRGVVRAIPPEQCPVLPEITQATRTDLFDRVGDSTIDPQELEANSFAIIEVPQWFARLEPKLAALDRDEPAVVEERSEQVTRRPEDPPPKQQELF